MSVPNQAINNSLCSPPDPFIFFAQYTLCLVNYNITNSADYIMLIVLTWALKRFIYPFQALLMFTLYRSYWEPLMIISILGLMTGCASDPKDLKSPAIAQRPAYTGLRIEQGPVSVGSEPRKGKVTALILHYTASPLPAALDVLQGHKETHRVGVHYIVTDELLPRVIQLVPETMSAFHAGKSGWRNLEGMNQHSIGIEIINLDGNVHPYSVAQTEVLFTLCADIISRHQIKPTEVLGHSDISVGRKIDPGSLFPWAKLASLGVGAWPLRDEVAQYLQGPVKIKPEEVRQLLAAYGYRIEPGEAGLKSAVEAFQRHFRTKKVDGIIDPETIATLEALVRRYRPQTLRALRIKP